MIEDGCKTETKRTHYLIIDPLTLDIICRDCKKNFGRVV